MKKIVFSRDVARSPVDWFKVGTEMSQGMTKSFAFLVYILISDMDSYYELAA